MKLGNAILSRCGEQSSLSVNFSFRKTETLIEVLISLSVEKIMCDTYWGIIPKVRNAT